MVDGGLAVIGSDSTRHVIDIPETWDGKPVLAICEGAFKDCLSLEQVSMPEGLLVIEKKAFSNCPLLLSITLPASLTSIANDAFDICASLQLTALLDSYAWTYATAWNEAHPIVGDDGQKSDDKSSAVEYASTSVY